MATLKEYFKNDFKDLSIDDVIRITSTASEPFEVQVIQRCIQTTNSSTRFFTFYIPETPITFLACKVILEKLDNWKEKSNGLQAIDGFVNDKTIGIYSHSYSNRVFLYTEEVLSEEEISLLDLIAKEKALYVTLRSKNYLEEKIKIESPIAFICHDSKDKELIARPLASGLSSRLCFVWYDEYSLKVGMSLRESIEKGIKEAKKCILILTPEFLSNPGWTKKEFNSIFTREMILGEKIIIPVRYGVSSKEVYEYSPSLADTIAIKWPIKNNFSNEEYKKEVEKVISQIHTAITS